MKTISVVVVAYNESGNLGRLKRSIDGLRVPAGWSVESVLVDNGSTDGTAALAEQSGFSRVVKANGTIAAARNAGARASSGSIVAYTDADCEVAPDWAERIVALVEPDRVVAGWPVEPPRPMTWVQQAWHAHWTSKRGRLQVAGCRLQVEGEEGGRCSAFAKPSADKSVFGVQGRGEEGEAVEGSRFKVQGEEDNFQRSTFNSQRSSGDASESSSKPKPTTNDYYPPITSNQYPESGIQNPATCNLQPATKNHEPSTTNQAPSTFNLQPSTSNLHSQIANQKSQIGSPPTSLASFTGFQPPQTRGLIGGEAAMTLITTANMSMRREVFEEVGGFAEELASGEDMNFLLRAQGMGLELVASPSLRVVHHGEPRTLRDFYRQQQWHCSKSSFGKILSQKGKIKGGNAVWFTLVFGAGVIMAAVGIGMAVVYGGWWLLMLLPLAGLLAGPAMVIAGRQRTMFNFQRSTFNIQHPTFKETNEDADEDSEPAVSSTNQEPRTKNQEPLQPATFNLQPVTFLSSIILVGRLMVLYAVYGWVRVVDLAGLGRRPRSWRSGGA